MTDLRDDKPMWGLGEVLANAWPASLSMLGQTVLQFIDGLMVSRLGPDTVAAQFMGAITSFVLTSLAMGMLTVINTYVSQNLGAGRPRRCGRYAWVGLALAGVYCATVCPWLVALAGAWFGLFDHGDIVTPLETMYFRYLTGGMVLFLASRVLHQFFYGIHRPGIVLATTLVSVLANVVLNYLLIFGKLGFPALGLAGAAIGTLISVALQLVMLLALFLRPEMNRLYATWGFRLARLEHAKELVRVGWPAGLQFSNDVLTWSVFNAWLVGKFFGPDHLAASSIAARYMSLSFMPAVGVGIATTAIVGRYIGTGRPDLARRRAHAAVWVAMAYMGLCAAAIFVFRRPMVDLFVNIPHQEAMTAAEIARRRELIIGIGANILICAAVFQLFDALGIVFIGRLRGAGDTLWPMILTIVLSWGLILGGGLAMVHWVKELTSIGPWIAASAYVIILGLLMVWRFESGAWRKIDLLGRRRIAVPAAAGAPG